MIQHKCLQHIVVPINCYECTTKYAGSIFCPAAPFRTAISMQMCYTLRALVLDQRGKEIGRNMCTQPPKLFERMCE